MSTGLFAASTLGARNGQSHTQDALARNNSDFQFGSRTQASALTSASTANMENTPSSTSGLFSQASRSQEPATSNPPSLFGSGQLAATTAQTPTSGGFYSGFATSNAPSLFGERQPAAMTAQAPARGGLFSDSAISTGNDSRPFVTSPAIRSSTTVHQTSAYTRVAALENTPVVASGSATPATTINTPVSTGGNASPATNDSAPTAPGSSLTSSRPNPFSVGATAAATASAPISELIPEQSSNPLCGKSVSDPAAAANPGLNSCLFCKPANPFLGSSPKYAEKPPAFCAQAQELKRQDPKETVVDPHGDLRLQVGTIKCVPSGVESMHSHTAVVEFLVDSRALARSSLVFSKMLYGPFAESKKGRNEAKAKVKGKGKGKEAEKVEEDEDQEHNQEQDHEMVDGLWRVTLPEDNIAAMGTLLHIMHCRFDKAPAIRAKIGLEDLYQISVLTDKYDCTALVRPWVDSWLSSAAVYLKRGRIQELEKISWIAWEYGNRNLFERAFRSMVLNLTMPGLFDGSSDSFFKSTLEPNGLKGTLRILFHHISAYSILTTTRRARDEATPGSYRRHAGPDPNSFKRITQTTRQAQR